MRFTFILNRMARKERKTDREGEGEIKGEEDERKRQSVREREMIKRQTEREREAGSQRERVKRVLKFGVSLTA